MTQIFGDDGAVIPVTVIQAGPCRIMQKKEKAKEGYDSVQIGFETIREKKATKAQVGHCKKSGSGPVRHLREIPVKDMAAFNVGEELTVDLFKVGDFVNVIGRTKGKGFAGNIKRHGFRGGAATHGSMFHRAPGSIGASSYPSRVFKGMKMCGHMGNARHTAQYLRVVRVDRENNLLLVKGAVPGSIQSLVVVINKGSEK
jgi:large subunit ribosomal protein L3